MNPLALRILWPAFLFAGVLEMMVFAVIVPHDMRWFGGALIGWSPVAIYSVTFFIFWSVIAGAGALWHCCRSPPMKSMRPDPIPAVPRRWMPR